MRIPMTEYLEIDLDSERWHCRRCQRDLGSARGNYKEGTLVYDRDPRDIHRPLIDPERYEFTFAPDPSGFEATIPLARGRGYGEGLDELAKNDLSSATRRIRSFRNV
jgi:Acetone carboxylase gamma subunit